MPPHNQIKKQQLEPKWAYAYSNHGPVHSAHLRTFAADFIVQEQLGFEPEGEGSHTWLRIRKTLQNTEWVAKQLARFAGCKPKDIGFAGLKDRHAVTEQWFSVPQPNANKEAIPWDEFTLNGCEVLEKTYHPRKLKRGVLKGNAFTITLRQINGDHRQLNSVLNKIGQAGIPNYFGPQRFGHHFNNWFKAKQLLLKQARLRPNERSRYYSVVRSYLFNEYLSQRIQLNQWLTVYEQDIMQLDGTHSLFSQQQDISATVARVATGDVHPTGPLWGCEHNLRRVTEIEKAYLINNKSIGYELEKLDVMADRRPLRIIPGHWQQQWLDDTTLKVSFELPAGVYATTVLREALILIDQSTPLEA